MHIARNCARENPHIVVEVLQTLEKCMEWSGIHKHRTSGSQFCSEQTITDESN